MRAMGEANVADTGEVVELLSHLIRNACVNDGSPESGFERRSAELLGDYLEGCGADIDRYEPVPGRESLLARIEGSDPEAPALMLMGHTDVVPVTPENWEHDPFGGELIDGEVWGRGAVDMLNLTSSMAVVTRRLAEEGVRPRGSLLYLGVADEEAAGTHGAGWLTEHAWDDLACDYVVTESGGMPLHAPDAIRRPVVVAEKGIFWCTLTVTGTPGHGSQPLRTDNALVKAARVVDRIARYRPETRIHDTWRRFVEGVGLPDELRRSLLDPDELPRVIEELPMLGLARQAHACTHTTFAPTMARGGVKHNVIPDRVELAVDVRTLPGQDRGDVEAMLWDVVGDDLRHDVGVELVVEEPASESPIDTPLWEALQRVTDGVAPGSTLVPFMTVGGTDARFFRRRGVPAYGFGLFSERIGFDEFSRMFHGDNERVDEESLGLTVEMFDALVRDLLL